MHTAEIFSFEPKNVEVHPNTNILHIFLLVQNMDSIDTVENKHNVMYYLN